MAEWWTGQLMVRTNSVSYMTVADDNGSCWVPSSASGRQAGEAEHRIGSTDSCD